MRMLILAAVAAFAFASAADATQCKDPKSGKFIKCPPPAAATASTGTATNTSAKAKQCKKGKPCGNSCIAVSDTCHK